MKRTLCLITLLVMVFNCSAKVPATVIRRYHEIVKLIMENKVKELSTLINYPIKRPNPIPDISTPQEFIANYNLLVDDAFKRKLKHYHDTVVFEHNYAYGLVGGPFSGDIWVDEQGKIIGINTRTAEEAKLSAQLTLEIQKHMHPSVNTWQENLVVARSKNLLIRIDLTTKGIRYASWSKGRPTSDKPDMILYNGVEEAQGTMWLDLDI